MVSAPAQTCQEFGGALGIAILASLGAAVYRIEAATSLAGGLSPQASAIRLHFTSAVGAVVMLMMAGVMALYLRDRTLAVAEQGDIHETAAVA